MKYHKRVVNLLVLPCLKKREERGGRGRGRGRGREIETFLVRSWSAAKIPPRLESYLMTKYGDSLQEMDKKNDGTVNRR